jgi:sodium-dependent dicarboxylate transporter 2/3/5
MRPESPAPSHVEEGSGRAARRVGLALGILACLTLLYVPTPLHEVAGYGDRPARAAAVGALMAIWWLFEALPIAWTACVPLLLFPMLGVFGQGPGRDALRAAEPFGDAYIFLFMGGMAIGAAMEQWNLHRRVALSIMRAIGTAPGRLLLGMLVATAVVSLWISNTATAVMMFPIALALVRQLESAGGGTRLPRFGTAVMLSVAYGANIGGIGSKIGTGTNSIFLGFAADQMQRDIGFLEYMAMAFPFVVLFVPVIWLVLWRLGRRDRVFAGGGREVVERELAAMGPPGAGERKVAAVFLCAGALWVLGDLLRGPVAGVVTLLGGPRIQGKHYEAGVAMLAAVALILWRALSWQALKRVPWSALLLLGGSFALAEGIEGSGLSAWMAERLQPVANMPLATQLLLATASSVGLSALASNTAAINVLINVLPRSLPVLAVATFGASCDFMLPAGTPPNAIVFGSGYIRLPVMMRTGFLLDVLAIALLTVYGYFWVAALA